MKVLVCHDRALSPLPDGTLDPSRAVCSSRGGGLAVYLSDVIAGLRRRGDHVAAAEFDPDAAGSQILANDYHRFRAFRFKYLNETVNAFKQWVRKIQPDVIHLQGLFYEIAPSLMRWLFATGIPTVWTLHDVRPLCFRGSRVTRSGELCRRSVGVGCVACGCYCPGERLSIPADVARIALHGRYLRQYRNLANVLVPSEYMRKTLVDNGFGRDRIEVTPLFSRYRMASQTVSARDGQDPCILFVGRLDRDKGVEQFIQALALLREQRWEAVVVGDGPQRDSACGLAAELDVAQRIRFAGSASGDTLADHYRASDMLVFSSMLHESFGLVGVEAMSFGKPVVAFRAGGVTEWLGHERTGLLSDHGNVPMLAQQIERLLSDAPLRERLGAQARAAVESHFTLDRHLDQLQEIYHRMLSEPRSMEVQQCVAQPYPC